MVITEDNYLDFQVNLIKEDPKIPDMISGLFRTHSILFIGYGLKDWNIRVLLKYFRASEDVQSFAIQRESFPPNDQEAARAWQSTVLYWERKRISVYNMDATSFLRKLNSKYLEDQASN